MKQTNWPLKAGVVIIRDDTFLLVQERAARVYGRWNLPSGSIEVGYSVEATAVREAKEETGLDVRLEQDLGQYETGFSDGSMIHLYLASTDDDIVSFPPTEVLDARWFKLEEVEAMNDQLVAAYVLDAIRSVAKRRAPGGNIM